MSGLQWLLSALVGSFIGSFSTYCFTRWRDKKLDAKKEFNELTAISNSICFYLALQQAELNKLSMDIKSRLEALQKLQGGDKSRDTLIQITQDFNICKNLQINIETAGKIILSVTESSKDIVELLQHIFISNEWYYKSITMLERFHELKRAVPHDEHFTRHLLEFINSNLPEYEKQIEGTISFSKRTLDSFREKMLTYFGVKINVKTGEVIKLN